MPLGIAPGDIVALVRDARRGDEEPPPILVTGVRASELAARLSEGGDPRLIRTAGDPGHASAIVHVAGGAIDAAGEASLRTATRWGVPTLAVQTVATTERLPYVLPGDTVDAWEMPELPVDAIAKALAAALHNEASVFAAVLPVLRPPALKRRVFEASVTAAVLAGFRGDKSPRFPVLSLLQARMLRDLETVRGGAAPTTPQETASTVGPELAAAVAIGFASRELVRALPARSPLAEGAVAFAGTLLLGRLALRLRSRLR